VTAQWNALSNAALGRGLYPNVDPKLATAIARSVTKFREWRANIGGFEHVSSWRDGLEQWVTLANRAHDMLAADGGAPKLPDPLRDVRFRAPALPPPRKLSKVEKSAASKAVDDVEDALLDSGRRFALPAVVALGLALWLTRRW
jgi:hypothetical protein